MIFQKRYSSRINLRPKQAFSKKPLSVGHLLSVFAAALVVVLLYVFVQWYVGKHLAYDSSIPKTEAEALSIKVGRLVSVPSGEIPSVALVEDPAKLSGQTFFTRAKAGDKVLIYATAKKAVLYRPSENRVIEMMPFEPPLPSNE